MPITQTSIGAARLGLTASGYVRTIGEQPGVTHFGDGTSRLLFAKHELSVTLGPDGRGVAVSTAAHEYTLRGGVAPCRPLAALKRSYRVTAHVIRGPFGVQSTVYQVGRLWFTVDRQSRIGRVTLTARTPVLTNLKNEPQCGTGEEG